MWAFRVCWNYENLVRMMNSSGVKISVSSVSNKVETPSLTYMEGYEKNIGQIKLVQSHYKKHYFKKLNKENISLDLMIAFKILKINLMNNVLRQNMNNLRTIKRIKFNNLVKISNAKLHNSLLKL